MNTISVLLADDHTILRKGLRAILESDPIFQIIGEAQDGRQAIDLVNQYQPDVVVMDIAMPNLNGIDATYQIKKDFPTINIIALTIHNNEEYIYQFLKAGASGYLTKQAAPNELVTAIKAAMRGEIYLSPSISKYVIEEYIDKANETDKVGSYNKLTKREREVLQMIAEGRTSKEIADILHITQKTVRTHRSNIMDKLDIHNIAGLTKIAIRLGLISINHLN